MRTPHDGSHRHPHNHGPVAFGRAFAVGIALIAYLVVEGAYGLISDSIALLADLPCVKEGHDLHVWAIATTDTALTACAAAPAPIRPS